MTFPLDDILLGPAVFGDLHRLDGLIFHTGEEPAFDRDYAVATAIWQATNPGSYNFRVHNEGVMLNVPYLEASGGINPNSPNWAPGRFAFLARELAKAGACPVRGCPGPYRNPTMHHLQISYVGRTAQLDAGIAPPSYLSDSLRLITWMDELAIRGPAPLVLSKHGHWQSNRSDCGEWMYSRLAALQSPTAQEPDTMNLIEPVGEYQTGTAYFPPGATYGLFKPGPNPDPSTSERDSVTTSPDKGTSAPVDGPWKWTGNEDGWWRVTTGPKRGWFLSRNGPQAEVSATPIALEHALDSANKRSAAVKTAGAEHLRKGAQAARDLSAGLEAAALNVEAL